MGSIRELAEILQWNGGSNPAFGGIEYETQLIVTIISIDSQIDSLCG